MQTYLLPGILIIIRTFSTDNSSFNFSERTKYQGICMPETEAIQCRRILYISHDALTKTVKLYNHGM